MKKFILFTLLIIMGILSTQSCKKKNVLSSQDQQYTDSMNTFLKLLVNNWHIDHISVTPNYLGSSLLPLDSLGLNTAFKLGYTNVQIDLLNKQLIPTYQNQTSWKSGDQAQGNILESYLVVNPAKYPGERINQGEVQIGNILYENSNKTWTASALPNTLYLDEDAYAYNLFDNHQGKTYKVLSISSNQMVLQYTQLQYTVTKYYLAQ